LWANRSWTGPPSVHKLQLQGSNEHETMIWLAALNGAGPISSTTVTSDMLFYLYKSMKGKATVYSFVEHEVTFSFTSDIKELFTYLIKNRAFPSTQNFKTEQFGTKPFTGSNVKMHVSSYSVKVR